MPPAWARVNGQDVTLMDLKRCVTRVGAGKWYYRVLEQTQVSPALARVNGELCSRHGEKLSVTRVGAGKRCMVLAKSRLKRCHPRGRG